MFWSLEKRYLFQGYQVVFPIHLMSSAISVSFLFGNVSKEKIFISFLLGYLTVYPLTTVQKRLMVQGKHHTMLPRRYLGIKHGL